MGYKSLAPFYFSVPPSPPLFFFFPSPRFSLSLFLQTIRDRISYDLTWCLSLLTLHSFPLHKHTFSV
jgi:hypothetical protein